MVVCEWLTPAQTDLNVDPGGSPGSALFDWGSGVRRLKTYQPNWAVEALQLPKSAVIPFGAAFLGVYGRVGFPVKAGEVDRAFQVKRARVFHSLKQGLLLVFVARSDCPDLRVSDEDDDF